MSRATLKELRAKSEKIVAEARAILDEIDDDTTEEAALEIEAKYDKAMAEFERNEKRIEREERQIELEEAIENRGDSRRPKGEDGTAAGGNGEELSLEERREAAFRSWIHGPDEMTPEERKLMRELRAQTTQTDASGGYLVPQGFVANVMTTMALVGPMVDGGIVRMLETEGGGQIDWPTLDDTANQAYRIGENTQETGSDGDLTFGNKVLDAYKYASGAILVPTELFEDAAVDVQPIIEEAMGTRLARRVNLDLTTGDGSGDPNGIVTAAGVGATATLADGISFDDLIELEHSVDPLYRMDPSVRWMFNDTTAKLLRKVKDNDANYIWSPANAQTGAPSLILNHPFSINPAMPDVADSQNSVVFGAFNRYVTRRVRAIAIRRLNERYAEADQVGFLGFARFDGELIDTAAVKKLAHPATN